MAEPLQPPFRAPYEGFVKDALGETRRMRSPEPDKDYSGWLTVEQYAVVLGVPKHTARQLVKRYVVFEKVFGRILIEPESAAQYKIRHDYTRRSAPPKAGN